MTTCRICAPSWPQEFPGVTFYTLPVDMVTQILNFGLAGADRYPGNRPQRAGQSRIRRSADEGDQVRARHGRPAHPAALQQSAFLRRCGPLQGAGHRADAAGCGRQPAGGDQRQLPDHAHLLARSQEMASATTSRRSRRNTICDSLRRPEQSVPTHGQPPPTAIRSANFSMLTSAATSAAAQPIQILGNVASVTAAQEQATVSHYNIAPVIDIYGNVVNTDLRSVSDKKIEVIVDQHRKELPRGSQLVVRGQVQTMKSSFIGLDERPGLLHPAGLSADRGQFPVVARSFHHHRRAARRAGRHCVDAVHHRHPHQRSCADRLHHVHGRGHGEFDSGGQLCPRAAGGKCRRCTGSRARRRIHALPPGA